MALTAVAFPVLPGKAVDGRRFAQEALDRREELAASFRRIGVTREDWFLQSTPQGDQIIVQIELDYAHDSSFQRVREAYLPVCFASEATRAIRTVPWT